MASLSIVLPSKYTPSTVCYPMFFFYLCPQLPPLPSSSSPLDSFPMWFPSSVTFIDCVPSCVSTAVICCVGRILCEWTLIINFSCQIWNGTIILNWRGSLLFGFLNYSTITLLTWKFVILETKRRHEVYVPSATVWPSWQVKHSLLNPKCSRWHRGTVLPLACVLRIRRSREQQPYKDLDTFDAPVRI